MSVDSQTVVVGVDGSPGADLAVRWAAELATRRGWALRLVHALRVADMYYGGGLAAGGTLFDVVHEDGERVLRESVALARSTAGNVTITAGMPVESPSSLLIALSQEAKMIVVGTSGLGGYAGMLLGSTAAAVASHAHCPVAVIRRRPDTGPVLVGVDGSRTSEEAIATAFEEASSRGAPLVALHAWRDVTYDDMYGSTRLMVQPEGLEDDEKRLFSESMAGWQEKYPDVEVRREVVRDRPRHALLERAEEARLVVVGSRGRGGFAGMLLGSTSQALVQHATCPVLVVRS